MAPRRKITRPPKEDNSPKKISKFFALKYINKNRHLYVKFHGESYWKCDWIKEERVKKLSGCLYHHWKKDNPKPLVFDTTFTHLEMCQKLGLTKYLQPERVLDCRPNEEQPGEIKYLVKWKNCDLDDSTWEDPTFLNENVPEFETILNTYILEIQKLTMDWSGPRKPVNPRDLRQEIIHCPPYFEEYNLKRPHLNMINRLRRTCVERRLCVLKRVPLVQRQKFFISFLRCVRNDNIIGPVLMVLPLPSMVTSWKIAFETYAPEIRVNKFMGNKESREILWRHEYFYTITHPERSKVPRFDVLLTTGLIYSCDWRTLSICPWSIVLIDSITFSSKKNHRVINSTVLPGKFLTMFTTSLHLEGEDSNNIFKLLSQVDKKSVEIQRFLEAYKDKNELVQNQVYSSYIISLQTESVEKPLEYVLLTEMTATQKYYYKLITKNFINHRRTFSSSSVKTYVNDLRLCCNHPFLLEEYPGIESYADKFDDAATILAVSGKCQMLLRLLKKMSVWEDRCLILCTSEATLTLIAKVLRAEKLTFKYAYSGYRNHKRVVEGYNDGKMRTFCYLVCLDKDRLILNPSACDTVILFDVDLERLRDMKVLKLARKRGCTIFRLTCRSTIEESISKIMERKMLLHNIKRIGKLPGSRRFIGNPKKETLNFIGIAHLLNSLIDDKFSQNICNISDEEFHNIWTVGLYSHEKAAKFLYPFPVCEPTDFTQDDIMLLIRDELLETGKVLPYAETDESCHMFHQLTLESSFQEDTNTFIIHRRTPLWCRVTENFEEADKEMNNFCERGITDNFDFDDCDIDMLEPSIGNEMRPIENAIVEKLMSTDDNQTIQIKYLKDLRSICQEGFILKLNDTDMVTQENVKKAQLTALFRNIREY